MSSHAQLLTTLENRHNVLLQPDFLLRLLSDKKMAESANRDEQVYNAFLETDIVQSSIPVIPPNFGQLHDILFPASSKGIILQINDIIDIENSAQSLLNAITASNPVRQVYQQAPAESNAPVNFPRGTLKLAVTDGYREVTALEVKRITSLSMNVPIGAKVSRFFV
jgi:RecQ mediated genome instability protein